MRPIQGVRNLHNAQNLQPVPMGGVNIHNIQVNKPVEMTRDTWLEKKQTFNKT